jgi:hypothetical protein
MELRIRRIALKDNYTIGKMEILYAGRWSWVADTLEDKVRDYNHDGDLNDYGEAKVYGETAIPYGKYEITMGVQSPKYSKRASYVWCNGYLPRLLNVKGFDGILIHAGNSAQDSCGCILVGQNKVVGRLVNSMETLKKLYAKLKEADDNGEKIWITIA